MALSKNPTRTRTIESNWIREINRRWAEFKRITVAELRRANSVATGINSINNADEIFVMSPSQQRTYMVFLQQQIDELLLVTADAPNWQARYQAQAYERGIDSTRRALISQGANLTPTAAEAAAAQGLTVFTAVSSLGSISGSAPIHADALEFLFQRSYTSLNGWTDAMAKETRQILFDGVSEGKGITEVVREMVARQDVSRSRASVIARTETIQAYQHSSANEAERASEELDEEVMMRWLTVRDTRVRHMHATWHGTVVSIKEYRRRIGKSPWHCRCGGAPVLDEFDTEAKKKKFSEERTALLAA